MKEKEYLCISEVSTAIESALSTAFPRSFWVVGEVQGLDRNRHRDHWYFDFCETTPSGETFRLGATIWRSVKEKLFGPGGKCAGVFDRDGPLDGNKIMARCKVDFYPPYGKISLHVQDVDPGFTLGELEARRKALLERLQKEGALERNARRPMPEVPLCIGLITSAESAAFNDFVRELSESGFGYRVLLCDARMQGDESLTTVPAAFRTLENLGPDLIVLIRGGGSRLDLSWFDREEIVYSVVECPLPVITGIGHEIDVTLAQMAANQGMKTPTAAAALIVDRAREFLDNALDAGARIAREARSRIRGEEDGLVRSARRIHVGCRAAAADARHSFDALRQRLPAALIKRLSLESGRLGDLTSRLLGGDHAVRLVEVRLALERAAGRLLEMAGRRTDREGQHLDLLAERGRLLDPAHVIGRGFALVRKKGGGIVKEVAGLEKGDALTVLMRDGEIGTEVKEIIREVVNGKKEKRQLEIW